MDGWGLWDGKLPANFNLTPYLGMPASSPPPGVQPNLQNPQRNIAPPVAIGAVLLLIMLGFLGCRIYSKFVIMRKPYWDDLACLLGAIGALVTYGASVFTLTAGSMGYHSYEITIAEITTYENFVGNFVVVIGGFIAALCIKIAFLIMYWKIFGRLLWMRIALLSVGIMITAATIITYGMVIYGSAPRYGESWVQHLIDSIADGSIKYFNFIPTTAVSLAADVFILLLPMPAVWGLNMPARRRFGLIGVFLAGILACVASGLNLYYRVLLLTTRDFTVSVLNVYIVTVVEQSVGVICASAPAAYHVFRFFDPLRETRARFTSRFTSRDRSASRNAATPSRTMGTVVTAGRTQQDPAEDHSDQPLMAAGGEKPQTAIIVTSDYAVQSDVIQSGDASSSSSTKDASIDSHSMLKDLEKGD